jgi:hypothetical protein
MHELGTPSGLGDIHRPVGNRSNALLDIPNPQREVLDSRHGLTSLDTQNKSGKQYLESTSSARSEAFRTLFPLGRIPVVHQLRHEPIAFVGVKPMKTNEIGAAAASICS